MTDINSEARERRKIAKGVQDLNRRCHCGKMPTRHEPFEVIQCKKEKKTESVVSRVDPNEIRQAKL